MESIESDAARHTDAAISTPTSPPSGPMTRARAKILQAKVNSLLPSCQLDTSLDGMLLHATTLCIIRYKASTHHQAPKDGEQGAEHEAGAAGAAQTGVSDLRTPESPVHQSLRPEDPGDSGPPPV